MGPQLVESPERQQDRIDPDVLTVRHHRLAGRVCHAARMHLVDLDRRIQDADVLVQKVGEDQRELASVCVGQAGVRSSPLAH
jgi:hypothetical protein